MVSVMVIATREILKGDVQRAREFVRGTGRSWRVSELRALAGALRVARGRGWNVGFLTDWMKLASKAEES